MDQPRHVVKGTLYSVVVVVVRCGEHVCRESKPKGLRPTAFVKTRASGSLSKLSQKPNSVVTNLCCELAVSVVDVAMAVHYHGTVTPKVALRCPHVNYQRSRAWGSSFVCGHAPRSVSWRIVWRHSIPLDITLPRIPSTAG